MKFPIKPSFLIAGGLAIVAVGWIYSGQMEEDPFATAPEEEIEAVEAEAEPVVEHKMTSVRVQESTAVAHRAILLYTGRTEVERRVTLRAETDGRVVEIGVQESDSVTEDTVVVKLAANDRFAKLNEAKALVRQREIEYEAAESLAGKGFQTESAKAEAEANLQAARAALEQIRVDIGRITLEAPFDGVVESRSVEIGDFVQAGDEVAVIADFDPLLVTIQVSEREIARVEPGVTADIELLDGQRFIGIVSRIATTGDSATRTFEVELEVANEDARLLDGMTAKVLLPAQQVMAHRITPALLTLDDTGQVGVKGIDGDNRVVFYPIQIVEDTPTGMWIAGLPRTVTLITVGQDFVAPGVEVEAVPADSIAPVTPAPTLDSEPTVSSDVSLGG